MGGTVKLPIISLLAVISGAVAGPLDACYKIPQVQQSHIGTLASGVAVRNPNHPHAGNYYDLLSHLGH